MTESEMPLDAPRPSLSRGAFWGLVCLVILTTFVPYLYGLSLADGRQYLWMGYNFDDVCVYLSWMRQGAEGSLRTYNLFTTDPQNGLVANPLFLVLGLVSKVTSLPLITVFQGARVLFAVTLFLAVKKLIETRISNPKTLWTSLLFIAFSSGIGWLPPFSNLVGFDSPIDRWQPEAITYLSLYLNPLFLASMTLQVLILHHLLESVGSSERSSALKAGGWGFLLALIHGYDIISLGVVWALYLIYQFRTNSKESTAATLKNTLVAGAITLPPALFMYLQLKSNSVFRQRVEVQTLTGSPLWILLGYGLTLGLALYAISRNRKHQASSETQASFAPFLTLWMIGNTLAAYLPFPFQRKMLQGTHLPIAILAALGICSLLEAKPKPTYRIGLVLTTLLLSISNLAFLYRDCTNNAAGLVQTGQHRPYLLRGEVEALDWIKQNVPKTEAVQPLPWIKALQKPDGKMGTTISDMTLACYLPSVTGHKVYCGHFGETPDYAAKIFDLMSIQVPYITEQTKRELLAKMHVKYFVFSQKQIVTEETEPLIAAFRGSLPLPNFLKKVYGNNDADVYEVQ